MSRKLKTYQTSLGFYDLALAEPSVKAALEAWGAKSNLFHQGAAKETKDPTVVAATMAKPGTVLRRPVGSNGPFTEHAAHLTSDVSARPTRHRLKSKKPPPSKTDEKAARRAAAEYERAKDSVKLSGGRKRPQRREQAIGKAQDALDKATREHEARVGTIEAERAALESRSQAEDARWGKQREKLKAALRRARE